MRFATFLPLLLPAGAGLAAAAKPRDAILLSQVESLTLRGDKQTTHRRVSAIPQLKCVSARNVCAKFALDVMRCENKGSGYDNQDIQWSCTAQLPPELKLGSTDVICEGYSSPDDPYVLKGSCGVEYRLMLTSEGEAKWPDLGGGGGGGGGGRGDDNSPGFPQSIFPVLFWIVFAVVAIFILGNICNGAINNAGNRARPAGRRYNGGGGGGGGGDGGDGWDDPPPPYPGSSGGRKSRWSGGGRGGGSNWQSNLASGAAGAAAGYYAGSRGWNNNNNSNASNAAPNYGSSWGSGGGGRSSSSGSSGGSAASTSRHESTGFGSTSRR